MHGPFAGGHLRKRALSLVDSSVTGAANSAREMLPANASSRTRTLNPLIKSQLLCQLS